MVFIWFFLVGIVVFLLISLVKIFFRVLIFRDSGVIFRSSIFVILLVKIFFWMAALMVIVLLGLIVLFGVRLKRFCTVCWIWIWRKKNFRIIVWEGWGRVDVCFKILLDCRIGCFICKKVYLNYYFVIEFLLMS